jgi:hypothetical protein
MATTSPTQTVSDTSTLTTVVGALALIAIIALIYFISRGRETHVPATPPSATQPQSVP